MITDLLVQIYKYYEGGGTACYWQEQQKFFLLILCEPWMDGPSLGFLLHISSISSFWRLTEDSVYQENYRSSLWGELYLPPKNILPEILQANAEQEFL